MKRLIVVAIFVSAIVFYVCVSFLVPAPQTTMDIESPTAQVTPLPLGNHFMIGHAVGTPVASTTDLIKNHQVGGVIIMGNVTDPTLLPNWIAEWQAAASGTLLIAIDQEGGPVSRIRTPGYTQVSQRAIGGVEEAYEVGLERGQELASLGITMNFAPVLDSAESAYSFMFDRVFTPRSAAADYAAAMARGMEDASVIAVAKHFPGHDDTPADSHFELPEVLIEARELQEFISPFTDYIATHDPAALMSAHVQFPLIDDNPATLSRYFLTDLLRDELGFNGVVITDDISMDAIDAYLGIGEASIASLKAGADIILLASEPELIGEVLMQVETAQRADAELRTSLKQSDDRLRAFLD